MNVPFSMSDEPDLGDELRREAYEEMWIPNDDRTPADIKLFTQKDMNRLIQKHIAAMDAIRNEFVDLMNNHNLLKDKIRRLVE